MKLFEILGSNICSEITNLIQSNHHGRPALVSENLLLYETLHGSLWINTATHLHQVLRRVLSKEFQTFTFFKISLASCNQQASHRFEIP